SISYICTKVIVWQVKVIDNGADNTWGTMSSIYLRLIIQRCARHDMVGCINKDDGTGQLEVQPELHCLVVDLGLILYLAAEQVVYEILLSLSLVRLPITRSDLVDHHLCHG